MSNTKQNIEIILNLPGNRKCADCASLVDQDTGWASLNLGVVMCIQCAGIHRAMGTHITKIRSFRLDTNAWTDKITQIFTTIGGNDRANRAVWESHLPSFWINPKIDKGSDAIRKEFVKSKYEKQLFLPPDQLRGRINNCLRKMPIEVRQIDCDFWIRGDKKYKTKEFLVIHSRWLSRYSSSKKSKASQQIDLTNFKLSVEENTTGFEEYDGYEFSLYEDTKYIVDNTKEIDNYTDVNDEKNISNNQSPNVFAHDEPLLRVRIKEFKQFVNAVQDIRSTMAYYRVYDSLFEIEPDDPPLQLGQNELELTTTKFLGFAKVGWSKRYFSCINGFVYQFKEDISIKPDVVPTAISAWDLQIIDCVLDENGKRSGSKFAVLIMNGNKTISLKFQSGPEAIVFFTALKQCWTNTRGKYYVDFSCDPPEISGDATGPQPIQIGNASPASHRSKSSFYMPNPQNGTPLTSPKEQDAIILSLIQQYEKNKQTAMQSTASNTFTIDTNIGGDISSTQTGSGSTDNDQYEDSANFEISETDDPLYRQVSQMTKEEQREFAKQNVKNIDINYIGGIPSYQQNNLNVPQVGVHEEHKETKDDNVTEVMNLDLSTLSKLANNISVDSDSYHTEPNTIQSNNGILNQTSSYDNENALNEAMKIEQQITMKNMTQQNQMDNNDIESPIVTPMESEGNNIEQNGYANGYQNENENGKPNDVNDIENDNVIDNEMVNDTNENEIVNNITNEIENDSEVSKPIYKAPEPDEQIYNREVTNKRMSGIVSQMKATLEKDMPNHRSDNDIPNTLPNPLIESKTSQADIIPTKQPINIQKNSQTYNNPSIDGTSNLSISSLLKQQQQPEEPPSNDNNIERYKDKDIDASTNLSVSSLLKKQQETNINESNNNQQDIDGSTNISVSALLKQQQQPEDNIEQYNDKDIDASTNISVSSLLKKQQETNESNNNQEIEQKQPEPSAEIVENNNISVSSLLQQQQQQQPVEMEQQPPEPSPEIVETNNLNVSSLLQQQNEYETEQKEPEPQVQIVETANVSVSSLLNKQSQPEPEPVEIIESENLSVTALLNIEQQNENNNKVSLETPSLNIEAEVIRKDSNKSRTLSPKLSSTKESEAVDNMAMAAQIENNNENDIEPIPSPAPIQSQPQPESQPIQPEPKPKPITQKAFTAPTKAYKQTNTFTQITGMNKSGGVAEKLAMFNQKNNYTIQQRNSPNKIRKKKRKKQIGMNGTNTNNNRSINENNTLTINKIENEPIKKRRHKHKKRKHKQKKKEINLSMTHLKITRWFNIDKIQLAKLNNPSFTNTLQQQLAKYGIMSVRNDKSYIKVQISRRIALPQRQEHWKKVIELLQTKLQGRNLFDNETIAND